MSLRSAVVVAPIPARLCSVTRDETVTHSEERKEASEEGEYKDTQLQHAQDGEEEEDAKLIDQLLYGDVDVAEPQAIYASLGELQEPESDCDDQGFGHLPY